MLDTTKLSQLGKEAKMDLIKCKLEIARLAYDKSMKESPEVQQVFLEYKQYCEDMWEKAAWALT